MVRAWYMDDSTVDQRSPHMTDPPQFVDLETLKKKTGILHWKLDADHWEKKGQLKNITEERGYTYEDNITVSKDLMPNYEEKIKSFFEEHLHDDEEIRFITDGSGYFDARDMDDKWIRVEVVKGDLLILPAGIYHRFTLDTKDYIKAKRLFIGEPVWTPHNRPAEEHSSRKAYLVSIKG